MTPKPSEILRPLLDEHGNVKGDSDNYRDKLFTILDTLDARLAKLESGVKVDLATGDGWPRFTEIGTTVYCYPSNYKCMFWSNTREAVGQRCDFFRLSQENEITHAQAVERYPDIGKRWPLEGCRCPTCSTVKPPLTVEPAEQPASVEAEAMERAKGLLQCHDINRVPGLHGFVNVQSFGKSFTIIGGSAYDIERTGRLDIARELCTFAARAVERYKASTAASEADFADRLKVAEDEREELKSANSFQYGQLLASRQQVVAEKSRADAAEKRVAELEAKLSAAESEARRLRGLMKDIASELGSVSANLEKLKGGS